MEKELYAAYVEARNEYWAVFDRLVRDHYGIADKELCSHADYKQAAEKRDRAYNDWLIAIAEEEAMK